jgi:hypothetical protein
MAGSVDHQAQFFKGFSLTTKHDFGLAKMDPQP